MEAVFAGHEGRAIEARSLGAGLGRADKLAKDRWVVGVAPREVVEEDDHIGIRADGDGVADGLVNGVPCHHAWVVGSQLGAHPDADDGSWRGRLPLNFEGNDRDPITCPEAGRPSDRARNGAALDLGVVGLDDGPRQAAVGRLEVAREAVEHGPDGRGVRRPGCRW